MELENLRNLVSTLVDTHNSSVREIETKVNELMEKMSTNKVATQELVSAGDDAEVMITEICSSSSEQAEKSLIDKGTIILPADLLAC